MDAAVAVGGLTVRYGRRLACRRVAFDVAEGEFFALLGRNGAGKSSLLRCVVGLARPQAGAVLLFGRDVWRDRARLLRRVGYVPEQPDAPGNLDARQLGAASSWMQSSWDAEDYARRLERFQVPRRTAFARLSKGQKSLLQLALALGHSPALLVLDDPTLGLDLVARELVFQTLRQERADRGLTVLLASHEIEAVAQVADRVGVLVEGRLVALGSPRELAPEGSLETAFVRLAGDGLAADEGAT